MTARHHSRTQGFTLVELLVVIAIIAVLAAILIQEGRKPVTSVMGKPLSP